MSDIVERLREWKEAGLDGIRLDDMLEAAAEIERLRAALTEQNYEIQQVLGKALGYPWFKNDQKNFPGATEESGVCVGEHIAESLADEAAGRIEELEKRVLLCDHGWAIRGNEAPVDNSEWSVEHVMRFNLDTLEGERKLREYLDAPLVLRAVEDYAIWFKYAIGAEENGERKQALQAAWDKLFECFIDYEVKVPGWE